MAWETTKTGQKYYYRGIRTGDRVKRVYVGTGDVGQIAAEHDAKKRAELASIRQSVEQLQQSLQEQIRPVRDADNYIHQTCRAILLDAGFRQQDRHPWMRRRSRIEMIKPTKDKPNKLPTQDEFKAVVDKANAGDDKALSELRQLLDNNPEIWKSLGNLPRYARESMLVAIAGKDESVKESLRRSAEELLRGLTTESSSPIERLAADRVVSCWLECHFVDLLNPLPQGSTVKQKRFQLQLKTSAQKRYDASLRSLATLKKLLTPEPEPTKTTKKKKPATCPAPQPTIRQCDPYNRIAIFNEVEDEKAVACES